MNNIDNILPSIIVYKFRFGKEKNPKNRQIQKAQYLGIFFLLIPLSPNYQLFCPENLLLAFPAFVQTAVASLLPNSSLSRQNCYGQQTVELWTNQSNLHLPFLLQTSMTVVGLTVLIASESQYQSYRHLAAIFSKILLYVL